mgnify:CR=1 FL=1
MTKKLQHIFALSEKGARDLVKAVIWCFVCNLALMFPVGAVLFTVQHLLGCLEGGGSPTDGFWLYVGFALAAVFTGEDGKCFILEFCVLPEHRGGGMGTACARTLLNWAREQGAGYAELNCTTPPRQRFWGRLGFVANGADEWGVPLMLLPPREHRPITVERLTDPTDWQLGKLENGYRQDIGEEPLTEEQQERLTQAVREGRITFLVARRDGRAVGMCSVAEIFSTFACGPVGQLEDFYVEPVFRRRGVARQLVQAAQALCWERSIASLTVCCAPCDEAMHRALGFTAPLGRTLAWLPEE